MGDSDGYPDERGDLKYGPGCKAGSKGGSIVSGISDRYSDVRGGSDGDPNVRGTLIGTLM